MPPDRDAGDPPSEPVPPAARLRLARRPEQDCLQGRRARDPLQRRGPARCDHEARPQRRAPRAAPDSERAHEHPRAVPQRRGRPAAALPARRCAYHARCAGPPERRLPRGRNACRRRADRSRADARDRDRARVPLRDGGGAERAPLDDDRRPGRNQGADRPGRSRCPADPAPASPTETSLELPWRLQISPNEHGAFAHSLPPIEHEGRYELWHTRLGVRAEDEQGHPTVNERETTHRTVRAILARDFPLFGFKEKPSATTFRGRRQPGRAEAPHGTEQPRQDDARPPDVELPSLRRQHRPWTPEAVPANRLMLTALGGWLDSRVFFDTLPDGGLTIEEWKHRAALGRDHEVKVVYSGCSRSGTRRR